MNLNLVYFLIKCQLLLRDMTTLSIWNHESWIYWLLSVGMVTWWEIFSLNKANWWFYIGLWAGAESGLVLSLVLSLVYKGKSRLLFLRSVDYVCSLLRQEGVRSALEEDSVEWVSLWLAAFQSVSLSLTGWFQSHGHWSKLSLID